MPAKKPASSTKRKKAEPKPLLIEKEERSLERERPGGASRFFGGLWTFITGIFTGIYEAIKGVLIIVEKSLKIVAIFMVAITGSVLFLFTSLFLFTRTFEVNQAPAFEILRDRMANLYVAATDKHLSEAELEHEDFLSDLEENVLIIERERELNELDSLPQNGITPAQ